eukprot:753023-Hanusia_phi.AAC.8
MEWGSLNVGMTVGLMLKGTAIDDMVIGGPAHHSNAFERGDTIVRVDGKEVNAETVLRALVGDDVPGGLVDITIKKISGMTLTTSLRRALSSKVAEKRTVQEQINRLRDLTTGFSDSAVNMTLNNLVASWSKMQSQECEEEYKLNDYLHKTQYRCISMLNELSRMLSQVQLTVKSSRTSEAFVVFCDASMLVAVLLMVDLSQKDFQRDLNYQKEIDDLQEKLERSDNELKYTQSILQEFIASDGQTTQSLAKLKEEIAEVKEKHSRAESVCASYEEDLATKQMENQEISSLLDQQIAAYEKLVKTSEANEAALKAEIAVLEVMPM